MARWILHGRKHEGRKDRLLIKYSVPWFYVLKGSFSRALDFILTFWALKWRPKLLFGRLRFAINCWERKGRDAKNHQKKRARFARSVSSRFWARFYKSRKTVRRTEPRISKTAVGRQFRLHFMAGPGPKVCVLSRRNAFS